MSLTLLCRGSKVQKSSSKRIVISRFSEWLFCLVSFSYFHFFLSFFLLFNIFPSPEARINRIKNQTKILSFPKDTHGGFGNLSCTNMTPSLDKPSRRMGEGNQPLCVARRCLVTMPPASFII